MSSEQDNTMKDTGDAGQSAGHAAGEQGGAQGHEAAAAEGQPAAGAQEAAQSAPADVQAGGGAAAPGDQPEAQGDGFVVWTENEILELRDTVETAGAVAHLAAARLHALMAQAEDEPGVDMAWFDRTGAFARMLENREESRDMGQRAQARIVGMAAYVHMRGVTNAEQLYLHDGGRDWAGQSAAYRQALDLFCHVVLTTAVGMERRKSEIERERRLEAEAAAHAPLKLEDSIFEPEESLGEMLPHAVEALGRPPAVALVDPKVAKRGSETAPPTTAQGKPMSVGEPPAGLKPASAPPAKPAKGPKGKKPS